MFAHRLEFFEKTTYQNVKYQIFYVENFDFEDQNELNKSKLKFVFVKIVVFIYKKKIEKQKFFQKKKKKNQQKKFDVQSHT